MWLIHFYKFGNGRTKERTDGRTDEWTGREHYASCQSKLSAVEKKGMEWIWLV